MKPILASSLLALGAALFLAAPALAESLTVVEHATSDTTAHLGKAEKNLGDLLVFANEVYDAANKTKVGTDQGFCIRITLGTAYECYWTLKLKGGQIMVQGPDVDGGDSMLAVTGGTGKYRDVRGEMKLHPRNPKGTEYDFAYTLVHAGK